ncbi:28S ribosomal protein S24, mitochondrial isoform X2 [Agrilus planipennis]|uniref:28S ribosomal protein S24, mitochondrial isoform X2 n=1 Tax=Agrilus planipennis TaxID=224129 RepID=A0A1W4WQ79_AGRPL|nr:28S ribosomal protein S24, mitochondrial isoform X2 [Agrilus planipennis]
MHCLRNTCLQIIKEHAPPQCFIHTTTNLNKCQAGRYRISLRKDFPLTYEMANPPHQIAHRKAWNSWNTSNVDGGVRPAETAVEDLFIRKFITGTWHNLFVSEVIIKRQHNIIRIAGIVHQQANARQMYFLIGYCEELLSYWLQCLVKMELQTVQDKRDVVFKYI